MSKPNWAEQAEIERAVVEAYEAIVFEGGKTTVTAEEAATPEYAAYQNAQRRLWVFAKLVDQRR